MSTVVKYNSKAPMLLSNFPGSVELRKALKGRFIGIISSALYVPAYKLEIIGGKLKVCTGPGGVSNVTELLSRYKEKELVALPEGIAVSLNDRFQIIGVKHIGDTNYDNFFLYSRLLPFPCVPVEQVKDDKPRVLLDYLVTLPSAVWNSGRIGVLPESGNMLHLTGPSIAPMVFFSLENKYKQMLKKVPDEWFETLLYYVIKESLPMVADKLIGTNRFEPATYERHIKAWLG